MGAANKVSGNKITGVKVLKKINPKRKKQEKKSEKIRSSLRCFHKKDFSDASAY